MSRASITASAHAGKVRVAIDVNGGGYSVLLSPDDAVLFALKLTKAAKDAR